MVCEICKKRIKNINDLEVYDNPISIISLLLHSIIINAGCLANYCLEELKQLLLGEDQGFYYLASKMLAGYSCNPFYDVETILNVMEKWGLTEYPYNFGIAVIKASKYNPELLKGLISALTQNNNNILMCILYIIPELQIDRQSVLPHIIDIAENAEGHLKEIAVETLEKLGK